MLIVGKSLKLLPPKPFFLVLICTRSLVGWGCAPDPTGGAYSGPPDPLAGFKGPTSKGREVKGRSGKGRRRVREEREGEGTRRKREIGRVGGMVPSTFQPKVTLMSRIMV